jgi:hypothetical protein
MPTQMKKSDYNTNDSTRWQHKLQHQMPTQKTAPDANTNVSTPGVNTIDCCHLVLSSVLVSGAVICVVILCCHLCWHLGCWHSCSHLVLTFVLSSGSVTWFGIWRCHLCCHLNVFKCVGFWCAVICVVIRSFIFYLVLRHKTFRNWASKYFYIQTKCLNISITKTETLISLLVLGHWQLFFLRLFVIWTVSWSGLHMALGCLVKSRNDPFRDGGRGVDLK